MPFALVITGRGRRARGRAARGPRGPGGRTRVGRRTGRRPSPGAPAIRTRRARWSARRPVATASSRCGGGRPGTRGRCAARATRSRRARRTTRRRRGRRAAGPAPGCGAARRIRRIRVSGGDSARASASATTATSRRRPRGLSRRTGWSSSSSGWKPNSCASASTAMTPSTWSVRDARSTAVRIGEVTATPSTRTTSCSPSTSCLRSSPARARRTCRGPTTSSIGFTPSGAASTPCTRSADHPPTTAPGTSSAAARTRVGSSIGTSAATYVSRPSSRKRGPRRRRRVVRPALIAADPRKGMSRSTRGWSGAGGPRFPPSAHFVITRPKGTSRGRIRVPFGLVITRRRARVPRTGAITPAAARSPARRSAARARSTPGCRSP